MAKLPSKRKLLREDLKEAPSWIDNLLGFINPFFEDVYFAFNKNITFKENIASQIRELNFETTATYDPFIPDTTVLQAEIDAIDIRIDDLEILVESLSGVPIGSTIAWDSEISLPIGFLKREGQEISRSTYDQLFAIIGTTFGAGDGSTTFNIPNSQGLVLRHAGTQTVGGNVKDGGLLGAVIEDQMQKITGGFGTGNSQGMVPTTTGAFTSADSVNFPDSGSSGGARKTFTFDSSTSPDSRVSSTTAGETRVSSISTIFIIRAQNLETASATSSAIDALNARVSTNETNILSNTPKWALLTVEGITAGTDLNCPDCPASSTGNILRVWNTLNGKNTSFISNSSGTLTINETGTYRIRADAYAYRCNQSRIFIEYPLSVEHTFGVTVNAPTGTTGGVQVSTFLEQIISFTAADTFRINQLLTANNGGIGRFGFVVTGTTGVKATFASLYIEKIS